MRILAIDTALSATSVCLLDAGGDAPLAEETLVMERGHAEALLPMIARIMAVDDAGFEALARIAVTVGPGSFTGLRVGIAAARAIGLACAIPVVGVSTLAVLAAPLILEQRPGIVGVAVDARHGSVYFAAFGSDGRAMLEPRIVPAKEAARSLGAGPARLAGSGAFLLAAEASAAGLEVEIAEDSLVPDILFVARLGCLADPVLAPARPLYLKEPDAKPLASRVG
jgi:tRNA threonylcarbamoyl adenosine modification protein YeaZ